MRLKGGRALERAAKSYIRPTLQVLRHRRELKPVANRTGNIAGDAIIVFLVARNEAPLMPRFLEHYRAMGVSHFIVIDNESTDGLSDLLQAEPDCSVWRATGSYRDANYGLAWVNHLLRRYGSGHWCLTVDADEFLVFPHCNTRDLRELTAYLDAENKRSFFTILLDMYPKGPLSQAHYHSGQDPLEVCGWFDAYGYQQIPDRRYEHVFVQGGVRRRVYFRDAPEYAPALNKVPLVKWRPHYAYLSSTHILVPARRNQAHFPEAVAPTGCLLHFKLFASIAEKAEEELERKQHYADSREYKVYLEGDGADAVVWNEASVEFRDWRQLVDHGVMNIGAWA